MSAKAFPVSFNINIFLIGFVVDKHDGYDIQIA